MPRKHDVDVGRSLEKRAKRQWLLWGRSPRRLIVVGLVLTTLAASLGISWLIEGVKGFKDLNGPHQQWHGVVVEHHQGTLVFTNVALRYSLVVGFIDQHNPSATFTVNVDADTYNSVPDGMLITLDLGPQTGHVYALATSHNGITWTRQPLDPGGDQLRLTSWLLVPFGAVLVLLGLLGLALAIIGLIDFLGGTETISGLVIDVVEGNFFRMPCVIVDHGNGARTVLPLRPVIYEKVCEDGGRSQMTFIVSRWLCNVRRARRKRGSSLTSTKLENQSKRSGDDWSQHEEQQEKQSSPPAEMPARSSQVAWSSDRGWVAQQEGWKREEETRSSPPRSQQGNTQRPLYKQEQPRLSGRENRQPESPAYSSHHREAQEAPQVPWAEQAPERPAKITPPGSREQRPPPSERWQEQLPPGEERLPQQSTWLQEDERSDIEAWRLWRDQLRQDYEGHPTKRPRQQK